MEYLVARARRRQPANREGPTATLSRLSIGITSASDVAGGAEAHTVDLGGRGLQAREHDVALYGRCPGWGEEHCPHYFLRLGPRWRGVAYVQEHRSRAGFLDANERIFRECAG
jgi:hypothetical protein